MKSLPSRMFVAILFVLCSCSNGENPKKNGIPSSNLIRIGTETYLFPAGSRITVKESPKVGGNYVSFDVGDDSDGRPTVTGLTLEYNQSFNDSYFKKDTKNLPWVKLGLPRVRWLVLGTKKDDLFVVRKPWGEVLCSHSSMRFGMYLACGSTFEQAGVTWQVLFHAGKLNENTDIIAEARAALRSIRVVDRPADVVM